MWRNPEHPTYWRNPSLLLWLPVLMLAASVILWTNATYDVDDAPITYRYAENLAQGRGFVYNSGEAILGTSTPLYTLLLAGLRVLGAPIPLASTVINFSASLGIFMVVMALTHLATGSPWAGMLAALYLLTQGSFLRFVMAGMETPLYTLIILLAFWTLAQEQVRWAAVWAALAFLMRLDGLAVMGAVGLALLLHQRRIPWRAVLLFLILVTPWLIFATLYFGSPLPQSMLAKQIHLEKAHASRYWIWNYLFVDGLGAPTFLLPVGLIGLLYQMREQAKPLFHTLPAVAWFIAYLVAYTAIGIDFYEWYLMPLYPVLALWVGAGLWAIIQWIRQPQATGIRRLWQEAIVITLLIAWFLPYQTFSTKSVHYFKAYLDGVEGARVQASTWLQTHAPPDARLFTGFIGHLGYETGFYVTDGAGLVTPFAQMALATPTIYVLDGYTPPRRDCGAVKDFNAKVVVDLIISFCNQPPYASFGNLFLANARITNFVLAPDGDWYEKAEPYLETQWLIDAPLSPQAWTLFVHFTNADGATLAQADHELGLQIDRTVIPPEQWNPEKRIYVYAEMPEDWQDLEEQVTALRIGLWNPATGVHLPATPERVQSDPAGRLVLPVVDSEIVP